MQSNPDPTSRFPTSYCLICGKGFPGYMACDGRDSRNTSTGCNQDGEVTLTPEAAAIGLAFAAGEVEAGTRILPLRLRAKYQLDTTAQISNPSADSWSRSLFVDKPQPSAAPSDGWSSTVAPAPNGWTNKV